MDISGASQVGASLASPLGSDGASRDHSEATLECASRPYRNCQGDKQKSLKLFEEVEMEMKSQLEEISLSHARVDKLVKACLESEPHNPIPTQTPSGVTLPFAASGSRARCLAFMSLRPFYYLFRPTPSRNVAGEACMRLEGGACTLEVSLIFHGSDVSSELLQAMVQCTLFFRGLLPDVLCECPLAEPEMLSPASSPSAASSFASAPFVLSSVRSFLRSRLMRLFQSTS